MFALSSLSILAFSVSLLTERHSSDLDITSLSRDFRHSRLYDVLSMKTKATTRPLLYGNSSYITCNMANEQHRHMSLYLIANVHTGGFYKITLY